MASNHHDDEVFRQKRKPKNPIKFKITLNEEQKEAPIVTGKPHRCDDLMP